MVKAKLEKQLMISVENKVGALADVSQIISLAGINLIAVCGYVIDNKGFILFVTEDNKKAKALLMGKNYNIREEEVVLVTLDNKPGSLQNLARRIADEGIDLNLIYGSADAKGKSSQLVLVSEDNQGVLNIVKAGQ
ncbi:MAG: ACT domain-containing protein [Candidatus Omnitrophota bacterium]